MVEKILAHGWRVVEFGALAVSIALLLHVLLGPDAGDVVSTVADNTISFLQKLPPGVVLGFAALYVVVRIIRGRESS